MSGFDPREAFGGWDDTPPVHVDEVLRRWSRILVREHPWSTMPLDDVRGMMRPLMSELLNEARDLDDEGRRGRLAAAARAHGAFRAAQECTEEDVVNEFGFVLAAIEGALRSVGLSARAAKETIIALDGDFWRAERAALRAWYGGRTRGGVSTSWLERLREELD